MKYNRLLNSIMGLYIYLNRNILFINFDFLFKDSVEFLFVFPGYKEQRVMRMLSFSIFRILLPTGCEEKGVLG